MESRVSRIASLVIERADAAHPADAQLRAELRNQPGLSRHQSRQIAQAVFAYYRWLGWLERAEPLATQLEHAIELAEQFAAKPSSFSDAELLNKAIPPWTATVMETPVEWLRRLQTEPTLWLRTRPDRTTEVAEKLGNCRDAEGTTLTTALSYSGSMDLFRTPEFQAGKFEVQDVASQAVGISCSPNAGETWWDACAGEGGKTLHLADLMKNKGLIWATDRVAWRLQRLKRRAARAQVFNYRTFPWDGSPKLPTGTKFDGVLVDAPCSAVGTWQRNPQARWTTSPQDVLELAQVQIRLLENATAAIKAGGKFIYSVCTLTRAETIEVVGHFEKRFPEFKPLPIVNPFEPNATPMPCQCWWPQQTRGNGMFLGAWRRQTQD